MKPVKALADAVRADRKPVAPDNPMLTLERVASTWVSTWLDGYRLARDAMTEAAFLSTYGSPLVQAIAGLGTVAAPAERRIDRDLAREAIAARWEAELESRFEVGGLREALIRALIHIRLREGSVDERGFAMLQALRQLQPGNRRPSMDEVKTLFRDQYMLVRLDEERAVRAIPRLLPESEETRRSGIEALLQVLGARGNLPEEGLRRLRRIEELFGCASREIPAGGASLA